MKVLARMLDSFARARKASAEIERLSHLSDAALARRGLSRSDIVAHVQARFFGVRAA